MTNNPYQHPSAGPSYYQGSTAYGGHSPVPRPNFYPYPPHMAAHPSPQYQQQTSSRGRGHVNGSYASRGSHHYHPYHPSPHASPYHHPSLNPPVNGPPLPLPLHPGQHVPYSPQSANKYNPSYSPSYHYPSPNAPVFTPSWQAQSPLSPLPKQLSMPPPQNVRAYYDSSQVPSAQPSPAQQSPAIGPSEQPLANTPPAHSTPAPTTSEILPADGVEVPEPTQASAETVVEPSTQALEPPPNPEVQETSIQPQSSLYSQTGTIQTSEIPGHLPTTPATKPVAQWAIWSRRPQDPSHAPSIIISPRARPPPDVVQQALDIKTPPPSPPPSPPPAQFLGTPIGPADSTLKLPTDEAPNVWPDSTVPSSAATDSEETPNFAGSPVSSHTSVSVVITPVKDSTEVQPSSPEAEVPPLLQPALLVVNPVITTSSSDTAVTPVEIAEADTTKPLPAAVASIDAVPSLQLHQPAVPDTPVAPPAPKKSWASLLRDSSSSSSLPTSSVVGFSIPGTGQPPPPVPVPVSRKSELLNLLTAFPAPATTGFTGSTSIRPRGLVNNGNMCFANSVLQVLVYCPPFHRLFVELGRLLSSDGVHNKDSLNNTNKITANGSTLINATASFLQEFLDVSEKRNRADSISRTGVNNSSGSGTKGSGKGKEKEFKDEKSVGDNWDQSFLPGYVYDVMKTKKRFDTMKGGHQEDAEEFFGFYLDTLEEELLSIVHSINPPQQGKGGSTTFVEEKEAAAPPEDDGWFEVGKRNRALVTRTIKSAESPITRIFGGKLRSTLRASGQKDSVIVEDWRSLRLDIQRDQIHTIQEALSYISEPQPVQVTQATKPGIIVDAQQKVLIEALPPILVLHIKRFHYDTTVGGVVKVGKHVRYGPELEIPSDLLVPAARKTQLGRYKLFGALYHHGQSASGGHYTLDVLHPTRFSNSLAHAKPREGWIRIDDELVSDVRPDDVFKTPEEDDTRCAYLLFYRRI